MCSKVNLHLMDAEEHKVSWSRNQPVPLILWFIEFFANDPPFRIDSL